MNEKTEELREIFTNVTDEETVTESQEEGRGSLEQDERTVEERLESVIEQMRERYGFDTPFATDELIELATLFYDGESDDEIADELGADADEVFSARLSVHLVRDDDAALAEEYGVSADEIRRYREVAAATAESRAANDRYRDEFDSILADADIAGRMTTDVREDGLEDATEGMETDVSF